MKISITCIGTTFTYAYLLTMNSSLAGEDIEEVMSTFGPAFITFAVCAFVAQIFCGTIEASMNSVILSVAMDDEMLVAE
jgi:hypothetical protein